jgi:serine/threonine protein kinase HipA of HipAB toxin-antitoxin module
MREQLSQRHFYLYNNEVVSYEGRFVSEDPESDDAVFRFYRMDEKEYIYLHYEAVTEKILKPMERMSDKFIQSQLEALAGNPSFHARNWWSMYAGERDARLKPGYRS